MLGDPEKPAGHLEDVFTVVELQHGVEIQEKIPFHGDGGTGGVGVSAE